MATEVRALSVNQFCELLGLDGCRLLGVRFRKGRVLVMIETGESVQTSGVYPALSAGGKKKPGKKR
ncbi:MAG: hypothetical protein NUW01_15725 [Gemmatimonadaceae bacterium]|nr:hypothetical protein [Gemmatimonadaceae bacterium]